MPDASYSDRELNARFAKIEEKLETIIVQTVATNGNGRKIIVALILAFGLIIGMSFDQFAPVLAVVAAL
jgi:tetrahydromethanopterin S-methyltransferase subunit G